MDFSTYTGLQAAIADFLSRPDLSTGGQLPGFIQLAEATIARRLRRSTSTATLTFVSGNSMALPSDVGELRSMTPAPSSTWPRGGYPLSEVTFETLNGLRACGPDTGTPSAFAVLNGTVYVTPAPSSDALAFTISYFTKFVPLSDAAPSNALLVEAPDAYLYGACLEAAPYLEHDERIPTWQTRFDATIEELNEKRRREEFGASLQKARLPVVF